MTQAFQITEDDIIIVVDYYEKNELGKLNPEYTKIYPIEQCAEMLLDNIPEEYLERIQKQALYGNDLETQTAYAHQELIKVFEELNYFIKY